MKQIIDKNLLKEYKQWLTSPNNPDYTGNEKFNQYDWYLKRLIEKAIEMSLIQENEISVTSIDWLNKFRSIYESNIALKEVDRKAIGNGGRNCFPEKVYSFYGVQS